MISDVRSQSSLKPPVCCEMIWRVSIARPIWCWSIFILCINKGLRLWCLHSVLSRFTFSTPFRIHPQSKMVYESTGKFQLVEGDVDNFDKMMEAVGEHSISFVLFFLLVTDGLYNSMCWMIGQVFRPRNAKRAAPWSPSSSSRTMATSTRWRDLPKAFPNAPRNSSWTSSRKRPPSTDAKSRY